MLNWAKIKTVFLDMDGTLLDLHFDNHFFLEYVPLQYAESQGISIQQSKAKILSLYKEVEGTMDWYCLDYWSRVLEMDIPLLKHDVDHLIQVHPHVINFLDLLKKMHKRIVMVTNAHQKSLSLKMEKTQLGGHFDRLISSHALGVPKENIEYWHKLQITEPYVLAETLLVDDSLPVLNTAAQYGFQHLLAISRPDSQKPVVVVDDFLAVENFQEVIAGMSL